MSKAPKVLPALPVRQPDAADHAYDAILEALEAHILTAAQFRAAYQAANMLRQYARHGIPPACECKQCRADRAPAKKGKRK